MYAGYRSIGMWCRNPTCCLSSDGGARDRLVGNHPIVVFSPSLDLVCQFTLPIIHTRHRTCAAARVRLLARALRLRLTHACAQHGTQHGTLSNGEVCARFLCLVRLPEVEKRMPQPSWSQANGWSPVCVRLCAVMLPDSEKRLPQPSWPQAYGRSPVCVLAWTSSAELVAKVIAHPSTLQCFGRSQQIGHGMNSQSATCTRACHMPTPALHQQRQLNTATGHALSHAAHKQASQHGTRDEDLTHATPTFPQIPHRLHLTHTGHTHTPHQRSGRGHPNDSKRAPISHHHAGEHISRVTVIALAFQRATHLSRRCSARSRDQVEIKSRSSRDQVEILPMRQRSSPWPCPSPLYRTP